MKSLIWPGGALLILPLVMAAAPASGPSGQFKFNENSEVSYHLIHMLHQVRGSTRKLQGVATLQAGRLVTPLSLEVPLISFRSGNANRDNNAAATLDVGRFPKATLTVTQFDERARSTNPDGSITVKGSASGNWNLHGVTQATTLPLEATWTPQGLSVDASFNISLSAFGIPRPSLLFKPVEDDVEVKVHAVAAPL
jgi:polyisoprenoid-binding protein YceI